MRTTVIYIHGKDGSAEEAEHYQALFPDIHVIGFDYYAQTPWEASEEFPLFFAEIEKETDEIIIISNSIGAFFTMHALGDFEIKKAYFISPIVNMEKLIMDMLTWAGATESDLKEKGTIKTSFGETLSWDYLSWIRNHPCSWNTPTSILYGMNDNLQSFETIQKFVLQTDAELTVMNNGEHWFHTDEQLKFLDDWISKCIGFDGLI